MSSNKSSTKNLVSIRDVTKHFGGIRALDNCNISLGSGKVTALIGPNGSGKTTLFNVISRLEKEDSGSIIFSEKDLCNLQDYRVAREGISRTFQQVRLFRNLTLRDHLIIAMTTEEGIFAKQEASDAEIKKILDQVHLKKDLDTLATELSYGERKLLDLAMALAKPHHLLMLDEPVAGVNPKLRKEIKDIIRDLRRKGETILLIEHDMTFVMDLADFIFVLDAGRIITQGKPKEIQEDKKVLEAYLGE